MNPRQRPRLSFVGGRDDALLGRDALRAFPDRRQLDVIDAMTPRVPRRELRLVLRRTQRLSVQLASRELADLSELGLDAREIRTERRPQIATKHVVLVVLVAELGRGLEEGHRRRTVPPVRDARETASTLIGAFQAHFGPFSSRVGVGTKPVYTVLVRFRSLSAISLLTLASLATTLVSSASAQDFDPRGRQKPAGHGKPSTSPGKPGQGRPSPGKPNPEKSAQPTKPTGATSTEEHGSKSTDESLDKQIEKYRKIVLAQPGAPFPLQRLAQLYRDRDGNLNALVTDFEARASQGGPDAFALTIVLAGIYKADGRTDDAIASYKKAIAMPQKSGDPTAILALARLLQDRGDPEARSLYERALTLQTATADKEQTLRTLMALALDAKDFTSAKRFHKELVKLQPTSVFVRGELGRELFQRAEYTLAEAEFKELVASSAGDNRALAPALKDLGKAQARAHENQEALATLKKALAVAGQEAAVRAEIYETITELYRADGQLPILVTELEKENPSDFQRLSLLGGLYEETGNADKALAVYKRALAIQPKHVDLRLKVIRVLQSQGEIDKAIAEYDALIRAAPNNPQFVFDQCDALMQRGDRVRALKLLSELEARGTSDEEILSRLADFYGRIGETERSLRVLNRLAQLGTNDPGHLADLGDQYFQSGNKPLAVQTWRRILTTVTPRARALSAVGDVYLEHDMLPDALSAYREACALEPKNLAFKKQLANALERGKTFAEAQKIWEELAEKAKTNGDKLLAREARTRLVTLWGFERALEAQVAPLSAKFSKTPADLEAGRTLAEVQLRLRAFGPAETTLRRVLSLAPGDVDTYLALERVLVQQNKYTEAIAVLEKLAAVEPKRAREVYQRMAQYALQVYRDDDAVTYAARAVELNPDDAEGHKRLGDMYRQRQDVGRAIIEYRAAIAKNERLYLVYLELADLLLSQNQNDEADRLFRRVIRGAPDEELVGRAGRLAMQINLGKGTLESLEQELLPLAIGNPQRKIYRRMLVEIYGSLTFAWMQKSRHGSEAEAKEANAALARIGGRAVKPLLDTLADGDVGQQRIAIDVLGYVQNKNAGPALFAYATGPADASLRTRAMLACGALRDAALLPKYEALIFPSPGASSKTNEAMNSDSVAVAATWAVAKLGDRRATPLLRRVLKSGSSNMRAFAALGLGASKDKSFGPVLGTTARSLDVGSVARAASALALGQLGATNGEPEPANLATLVALAQGTDPLPKRAAMAALARLGANGASKGDPPGGKSSLSAMADALFASDGTNGGSEAELTRNAAASALVLLATHGASDPHPEILPTPNEDVLAETTIEQLVATSASSEASARALTSFADPLREAAKMALTTSGERAMVALNAMSGGDGSFEPLVTGATSSGSGSGSGDSQIEAARKVARSIARELEPQLVALTKNPDAEIREKALILLSRSDSDAATTAIAGALEDADEHVQRAALGALGKTANAAAVASVAKVLRTSKTWPLRVLAAEALGRIGKAGASRDVVTELRFAATKDDYALVREAALLALATFDRAAARDLAKTMASSDPEPRVQKTAQNLRNEG